MYILTQKKTLYYVPNCTCDNPHTMHPTLLLLWSYDPFMWIWLFPTRAGSGTQAARHSHTTYCIQMWVIHLIAEIKKCLPSMLTHRLTILIVLTAHLYFSGIVTVILIGTAFLSPHLITSMSLGQTHLMDTINLITVRLHTIQVIMTLMKWSGFMSPRWLAPCRSQWP